MKLVIPVSDVDLDRAKLLAKRIVSLGQMEQEHVIVVSTWRAQWDIIPMMETLQPGFKATTLYVVQEECETGWPEAANHLFYEGMNMLRDVDEPVYWFEADCFPLRAGWWQRFVTAYAACGKPYMGFVNVSRFYDWETEAEIIDGQHLVGTGIYPGEFMRRCERIHHVDRIPWDVYIGPEVAPQCAHTDLIAHRWNTCNYRFESGQLVCDDMPHKWHSYAAPIPQGTAIIHGDKSQSLYMLANDPATNLSLEKLGQVPVAQS